MELGFLNFDSAPYPKLFHTHTIKFSTFPPALMPCKWSLAIRSSIQKFVRISLFSQVCYKCAHLILLIWPKSGVMHTRVLHL